MLKYYGCCKCKKFRQALTNTDSKYLEENITHLFSECGLKKSAASHNSTNYLPKRPGEVIDVSKKGTIEYRHNRKYNVVYILTFPGTENFVINVNMFKCSGDEFYYIEFD